MLRTNLSTRPFYNVRAAHVALRAAGVILLGAMLFNVVQVVRLGMSQQSRGARAGEAEEEAARLRTDATQILAQINPQELQVVADAAREANQIIDQRAFSWTELFGRFEATLPSGVRLTAVRPRLESTGDFVVAIGVEARRAEDLDAFVEALETNGGVSQRARGSGTGPARAGSSRRSSRAPTRRRRDDASVGSLESAGAAPEGGGR